MRQLARTQANSPTVPARFTVNELAQHHRIMDARAKVAWGQREGIDYEGPEFMRDPACQFALDDLEAILDEVRRDDERGTHALTNIAF